MTNLLMCHSHTMTKITLCILGDFLLWFFRLCTNPFFERNYKSLKKTSSVAVMVLPEMNLSSHLSNIAERKMKRWQTGAEYKQLQFCTFISSLVILPFKFEFGIFRSILVFSCFFFPLKNGGNQTFFQFVFLCFFFLFCVKLSNLLFYRLYLLLKFRQMATNQILQLCWIQMIRMLVYSTFIWEFWGNCSKISTHWLLSPEKLIVYM